MPTSSQLGVKTESTFATAVTVDRFFEFDSEGIDLDARRIDVVTKRAGQRVQRSDRFAPYIAGAAGSIELPVLTKGHGWWLTHALGSLSTGTITDSNYTHTATIGTLTGKSFTTQIDRQLTDGTSQAFTWAGCKITQAVWKMAAEGHLIATYDIDAASETTATSLASVSYPAAGDLFSFVDASATIAGSSVAVKDFEVSIANSLNVDRRYIKSSAEKKEQIENGSREIAWKLTVDFDSLTQYNRFKATTAATNMAAIVITCNGPAALAGSTLPQMSFSIPAARFDGAPVRVADEDIIMVEISGRGLYDGTNSALTVTYRSNDATA